VANNRVYLICREHPDDPFYLAKYFPRSGWYNSGFNNDWMERLKAWLGAHSHEDLFVDDGGDPFALRYEAQDNQSPKRTDREEGEATAGS
jgi:hypothetical protein